MKNPMGGGKKSMSMSTNNLFNLMQSEPNMRKPSDYDIIANASPGCNSNRVSTESSPYMSPWNTAASPFVKSPWIHNSAAVAPLSDHQSTGLVGSLIREEGHLYSLAASGDLLYTGSDSKNIRVWKNSTEFAGFKSSSGLVKAIIIAGDKVFTGHQDGKIRVWRVSPNNPAIHKRLATLPSLKDFLMSSINPANYVTVRRHRNTVWLRHFDAVSCLSLDPEAGILYSGSWDRTFKVWRISDSKCLESITAHDDAINSLAVGFDGLIFTGSADGTVKVWRRETIGNGGTRHVLVKILLQGENAVTALAVSRDDGVVYSGSSDGMVNYWESGRRLVHGGVINGHKFAVLCLTTAGRMVISGSADTTIGVWRREAGTHTRVSVLSGHLGPVKCLAVEEDREYGGPEGTRWILYSGSLDKSVKVWRVFEGRKNST